MVTGSVGRGSDGAAYGLQDQRHDITANEDKCVGAWLKKGEMRSIRGDDACQAEVDGCCEKGRADCETDKVSIREWIYGQPLGYSVKSFLHTITMRKLLRAYSRKGSCVNGLECIWTRPA